MQIISSSATPEYEYFTLPATFKEALLKNEYFRDLVFNVSQWEEGQISELLADLLDIIMRNSSGGARFELQNMLEGYRQCDAWKMFPVSNAGEKK